MKLSVGNNFITIRSSNYNGMVTVKNFGWLHSSKLVTFKIRIFILGFQFVHDSTGYMW